MKETFRLTTSNDCACYELCSCRSGLPVYRATDPEPENDKWKPAIFMPRWASRITLEIVSIRVERVKEITEHDALSEGVFGDEVDWADQPMPSMCFEALWDSINGKTHPWSSNPWVWVIEFKQIEPKTAAKATKSEN